jgi:excisionase family DNA binding protein
MSDLITKVELEVRLKLHRNTVTRLLAQGRFPNAFRTGGRWRIPLSDLEAFVRGASAKELRSQAVTSV